MATTRSGKLVGDVYFMSSCAGGAISSRRLEFDELGDDGAVMDAQPMG